MILWQQYFGNFCFDNKIEREKKANKVFPFRKTRGRYTRAFSYSGGMRLDEDFHKLKNQNRIK